MNYEPARDPSEQISRLLKAFNQLQAANANELARFRSEFGASHESLEAVSRNCLFRQEQLLASFHFMEIDEITRQNREGQFAQEEMERRMSERTFEIQQSIQSLHFYIEGIFQAIIPRLPKRYGSPEPYRSLPGEGLKDPEDPQEVEIELNQRNEIDKE